MTTYGQALIVELAKKKPKEKIVFDPASGNFKRSYPGRGIAVISDGGTRTVAEKYVGKAGGGIERITKDFIDGKIDLSTWQQRMAQEIKDTSSVAAMLGRGGKNSMTPGDWGRLGARLREQYRWLNSFAADIASGNLTPAEIMARAQMYARACRTSYFDGLDQAKAGAGYSQEMRVLGAAEHCGDCPPLAGYWAPLGSLPVIGQTACRVNCRCTKVYRKVTYDEQGNEVVTSG